MTPVAEVALTDSVLYEFSGFVARHRKNPFVLVIVILFHVVLIVLFSINLIKQRSPEIRIPETTTIKAVVVDADQFDAEVEKKKRAELDKSNK